MVAVVSHHQMVPRLGLPGYAGWVCAGPLRRTVRAYLEWTHERECQGEGDGEQQYE